MDEERKQQTSHSSPDFLEGIVYLGPPFLKQPNDYLITYILACIHHTGI